MLAQRNETTVDTDRTILRLGCRLLGIVALVAILGAWIWYSRVAVSVALDYPIRRAGASAEYPPRASAAFYVNCIVQPALTLAFSSWVWGFPTVLALWLAATLYPNSRRVTYWSAALSCVLLPVIGSIFYELFVVYG
jgi:hypothetical protein